mmetsp:Transcript_33777/g.81887  ORF Transcript_33777/g.81887 Transcript_33777/m.81887 type:complete len:116 (+) Transcript_33777:176-523(+)
MSRLGVFAKRGQQNIFFRLIIPACAGAGVRFFILVCARVIGYILEVRQSCGGGHNPTKQATKLTIKQPIKLATTQPTKYAFKQATLPTCPTPSHLSLNPTQFPMTIVTDNVARKC